MKVLPRVLIKRSFAVLALLFFLGFQRSYGAPMEQVQFVDVKKHTY